MLDVFVRFLSRLREQRQDGDEVDDHNYDDYWMQFDDLYVSQRTEYDKSREALEWNREDWFPTVVAGMAIRNRAASLTDHEVLDAWSIFAQGADGTDFPWYQSVQSFFEQRDEALRCNLSWRLLRWAWLYVVSDRYPWLELRYCRSLGDDAARSMLFLPDRPS